MVQSSVFDTRLCVTRHHHRNTTSGTSGLRRCHAVDMSFVYSVSVDQSGNGSVIQLSAKYSPLGRRLGSSPPYPRPWPTRFQEPKAPRPIHFPQRPGLNLRAATQYFPFETKRRKSKTLYFYGNCIKVRYNFMFRHACHKIHIQFHMSTRLKKIIMQNIL